MSEFPDARERYERFDRPILAYHFSDDTYAPRRGIDALFKVMSSAPVTQRNLSPADLGVASVGHFGFFRPSSGAKLWDEAAEFLLSAVRELPRTAA
jgi:predicted alpha/beta hydrolase